MKQPIIKPGTVVLGIDPGTTHTAWVLVDADLNLLGFGKSPNSEVQKIIRENLDAKIAIEVPQPRGQHMTWQLVYTAIWIGRFVETAAPRGWLEVDRMSVKMHICGSARAKDGAIRSAIVERWGGKDAAIGKKATPGPLYGVSKDVWQAFALAITVWEGGVVAKAKRSKKKKKK